MQLVFFFFFNVNVCKNSQIKKSKARNKLKATLSCVPASHESHHNYLFNMSDKQVSHWHYAFILVTAADSSLTAHVYSPVYFSPVLSCFMFFSCSGTGRVNFSWHIFIAYSCFACVKIKLTQKVAISHKRLRSMACFADYYDTAV